MAYQETPYKFYVQQTGGEDYLQIIPWAGNDPYGMQEITKEQYLQKKQQQLSSNPTRWNPYFQQSAITSVEQKALSGAGSGYTMVNGVPTQVSALQEQQQMEQLYQQGLADRVRVGNGWAYIPKGSSAAALQQGIQSGQVSATGGAQQQGQFLQQQGFQPTMPTQTQQGTSGTTPSIPPAIPPTTPSQPSLSFQQFQQSFPQGTQQQYQNLIQATQGQQQQPQPQQEQFQYTVKSGDSLSAIAARLGVNWKTDITGYRSGDPNLIFPGEVLTIKKAFEPIPTQNLPPPEPIEAGALEFEIEGLSQQEQSQEEQNQFIQGKTFDDFIEAFSKSLNFDEMSDALKLATKNITELENQEAEDIENIRNNPWISEELRMRKETNAREKHGSKRANLTNELRLAESQLNNAREEIRFAAKMAYEDYQFERKLQADEKALALKLFTETNKPIKGIITSAGGKRLLINPFTGAVIKDLGVIPKSSLSGTGALGTGGLTVTGLKGFENVSPEDLQNFIWDSYNGLDEEQYQALINEGLL